MVSVQKGGRKHSINPKLLYPGTTMMYYISYKYNDGYVMCISYSYDDAYV